MVDLGKRTDMAVAISVNFSEIDESNRKPKVEEQRRKKKRV